MVSDLSSGMLRHSTGRVDAIACASGEQLPFKDASFNNVYAVWVLHMTNLDRLMAEVARALRPNGRFISVPAFATCPPQAIVSARLPGPCSASFPDRR